MIPADLNTLAERLEAADYRVANARKASSAAAIELAIACRERARARRDLEATGRR